MWVEPDDLAERDLFYGPWGAEHAPDPKGVYTLVERKHTGVNLGMTVKDEKGREWSVKQPYPGRTRLRKRRLKSRCRGCSRRIGYHQPPVYYLPAFTLKDDFGKHVEVGGRFRLKDAVAQGNRLWKWEDNPFVGTKPYQGLIVMLMMFNSTDLKNTNNSLYEYRDGDLVEQWYVARDLGAALGDYNPIAPRKNHPETRSSRCRSSSASTTATSQFAYNGWYKNLVAIASRRKKWRGPATCSAGCRTSSGATRSAPAATSRPSPTASSPSCKEKIEQGRALGARVPPTATDSSPDRLNRELFHFT